MVSFAINHITMAEAPFESLLDTAVSLGCDGIEIRNDLNSPLFDGMSAQTAGAATRARGLRIFSVAEVSDFNDSTAQMLYSARALMETAAECGAEAISLIPRNDGQTESPEQRWNSLLDALEKLQPLLEHHELVGMIEPLGFQTSSVRSKREVVEVIETLNAAGTFMLVHDTFHHALAGDGPVFSEHTGMVHVSGVDNNNLATDSLRDEHRVLVNKEDCLGNLQQLTALRAGGYSGPVSMEAFSPLVHALSDPAVELAESFDYIASSLAAGTA